MGSSGQSGNEMDLHPEFEKLVDHAVEKAARKYVQGPWFNWRAIFQGLVAAIVAAFLYEWVLAPALPHPSFDQRNEIVPPTSSSPEASH